MEPIFLVGGTVLVIGIARMAAALVQVGGLLSVDVLETTDDDPKQRQFNTRQNQV